DADDYWLPLNLDFGLFVPVATGNHQGFSGGARRRLRVERDLDDEETVLDGGDELLRCHECFLPSSLLGTITSPVPSPFDFIQNSETTSPGNQRDRLCGGPSFLVVRWEQKRCHRPIMFRDDPELLTFQSSVSRQKAAALLEGLVIQRPI